MVLLILLGAFALMLVLILLWRRTIQASERAFRLELESTSYDNGLGSAGERLLPLLIERGERIAAIRHYRQLTGVSLKRARDAIEEMLAGRRSALPPFMPIAALDLSAVRELIVAGERQAALQRYQEATGLPQRVAARAIEAMEQAVVGGSPEAAVPGELERSAWEEIRAAIRSGEKLKAVKLYRELTGASLLRARQAIERLEQSERS
ncbi:hypothetical protein [Thermogemmatispora sp.]|uniref:hypothetical protein n=1 Tax=Thermogemmatispora sp. TaxID=1968838 RepID=UPI0035E3F7E1